MSSSYLVLKQKNKFPSVFLSVPLEANIGFWQTPVHLTLTTKLQPGFLKWNGVVYWTLSFMIVVGI